MNVKPTPEAGFSYLEVIIAVLILTVGIMAQLTALTFSMVRARDSEQRTTARQIANSTIESIFAARDLGSASGLSNWDAVNLNTVNSAGIFISGWTPIREDAGIDGIQGTADDACSGGSTCVVGGYTNTSQVIRGFERQILITDIPEAGFNQVRKRRVEVKVRYYIGQVLREETMATMVANLPFYK